MPPRKYHTPDEQAAAKRKHSKDSWHRRKAELAAGEREDITKPCTREGCDGVIRKGTRSSKEFNARRFCSRQCSAHARHDPDAVRHQRVGKGSRMPAKPRKRPVGIATPSDASRQSQPIWRPSGWSSTPTVSNTARKDG